MAILDFFRRRSPTAAWREDRTASLLADLDRFELSGVGFGAAVEDLHFLGPSESDPYDYPSKGLILDADEDGRLDGLVIALRDDVYFQSTPPQRVRRFAGRIRLDGRDREPLELRHQSDFVEVWGEPYWIDVDEEETLLFFELGRVEVQVELTPEGVPQVLVVTPEPLMADPEQRRQYGVTRSWPPTGSAGAP